MTKQQTVELLQNQLPGFYRGFYSVEQVISIINDIEDLEKTSASFDSETIAILAENIASDICSEGTNILDDYDLEMNYREVEVSSIELNEEKIARIIKDSIADYVEETKDSKEEK